MSLLQNIIDLARGKKRLAINDSPLYIYNKLSKGYKKIATLVRDKAQKGQKTYVGFVFMGNLSVNPFFVYLYRFFEHDPRFEPYMVVAPYTYLSFAYMKETAQRLVELLENTSCRVISGYDFSSGEMVDIQEMFSKGLLFFMDPYEHITDRRFIFKNFIRTSLTYYIPYSYFIVKTESCYTKDPHKYAYKIFHETALHEKMLRKLSPVKGRNFAPFLGYLGSQRLLEDKERNYDWKCPLRGMKKVIIAPHHLLGIGNFLRFYQTYLDIAHQYQDRVSFVFKPHPILRESVLKYWSPAQIDAYLNQWDTMPNTKLETGDYEDLFFTSDAMILDSISFCAEYSLLCKPFLFLEKIPPYKFNNPAGIAILRQQYVGNKEEDIYDFIERIVLAGNDVKRENRNVFAKNFLVPENKNVAENIYNYVISDLGLRAEQST